MKNKIDILIHCDFTASQFISNLNKSLKKKFSLKIRENSQDKLSICMLNTKNYVNKTIVFLSQIEKTFSNHPTIHAAIIVKSHQTTNTTTSRIIHEVTSF